MSVLLLPTSQNCILRGNMHSKARQFHTVKVPPGVIGEGRAITKAVTPTASYPDQRVVGNSCNVSPRLERAMQVVSSQNGPYETVPPMSSSFNRPPLPIHQIFQQNPPDRYTDDMICNLKSRSFSKVSYSSQAYHCQSVDTSWKWLRSKAIKNVFKNVMCDYYLPSKQLSVA